MAKSGPMKNICPVCGFDGLEEPPYDDYGCASYEVCSCCGFEYGFHDLSEGISIDDYRRGWVANGGKWFYEPDRPKCWSMSKQLLNIGIELPAEDLER